MRDDICIYASPRGDRAWLERLAADRNRPRQVIWRAAIVPATADGLGPMAIMRRMGKSKPTPWRWRERYLETGVEGPRRDKTRRGRKKPLSAELKRGVAKKGSGTAA